MNKAITITLNEIAFEIEDSAYEKLKEYFDSVENYFKKDEAKEEIIKDIENSFASKLEEKLSKRKQKIVLEKDIEELIKIIGRVEDFEKEDIEGSDDSKKYTYRKLYRNPNDIVIAGVCSGIASYLGTDTSLIRIVFVLFTIFTGFFPGTIIYLVLWGILPMARTGTEKLEMDGENINLKNIKEKIYEMKDEIKKAAMDINEKHEIKDKIKNIKRDLKNQFRKESRRENRQTRYESRSENYDNIPYIILRVILLIVGVSFIISAVSCLIGMSIFVSFLLFNPNIITSFISVNNIPGNQLEIIAILGMLVSLIPIIFILKAGISMVRMRNSFRLGSSIALIIIWVFLITALTSISIRHLGFSNVSYPKISINTPTIEYKNINLSESSYDLSNFKSINVRGPYNVNITKSDTFFVKAKSEEYLLDNTSIEVDNEELKIKTKNLFGTKISGVYIEIGMPSIDGIDLNGMAVVDLNEFQDNTNINISLNGASNLTTNVYSKKIKIDVNGFSELKLNSLSSIDIDNINISSNGASKIYLNNINVNTMNARLDGASYLEATGNSNYTNIKENGASSSDLSNLNNKNSKIVLDGASNSKINSLDYIDVRVSGSSNLEYSGNPKINQVVRDLSTVKKITEELNTDYGYGY